MQRKITAFAFLLFEVFVIKKFGYGIKNTKIYE